jgi:integrase
MSDPESAYPHVKPWRKKPGARLIWRWRRNGRTIYLPGEPFTPAFDAAYQAILAGRPIPKAQPRKPAAIIPIPTAAHPRSFRAAWRLYVETSPDWQQCRGETRARQSAIAEAFLLEPVAEGAAAIWGDMAVADMKRRHIKMILTRMSATPFAARHRLSVLRKMIEAALDEEWIEADPTHKIKYRPERIAGWRPWTPAERDQYRAHWPLGTTARLVYELAFWLGTRRSNVASLRWADLGEWHDANGWRHEVFRLVAGKNDKPLALPVTPDLAAALQAAPRTAATVLATAYGKPFSAKSLTGHMQIWTQKAGLPAGCTIHGLRKSLGVTLTEAGGTTRQAMAQLGHDDIAHAELYSREAEQARLAVDAMAKVVTLEAARRRR